MLIIGGLASGPQIAPTVPPEKYGQAAIAFIVRYSYYSTITQMANYRLIVHKCIYVFAFNMSWGPLAWSVATEMCVGPNRSKIMGIGTAAFWSKYAFRGFYVFMFYLFPFAEDIRSLSFFLVVAWAVTFTLPYLYDPVGGAGLGMFIYLFIFPFSSNGARN